MWLFYDDKDDYERERDRVLRRFRNVLTFLEGATKKCWQA